MNLPRTAATGFFAWMLVATVHAATTEQEIEHLISYLGNSGCTYVRNGMAHDSGEAVEHLADGGHGGLQIHGVVQVG